MGLFNRKKEQYEDYDLNSLEDLVYDEEITDEDLDLSEYSQIINENKIKQTMNNSGLFSVYDIDEDGMPKSKDGKHSVGKTDKETEKKRQMALKEEEKYDHMLNSIQAQDLIKTVDRINNSSNDKSETSEKDEFFAEKKVLIPDVNRKPKNLEHVNFDKFKGQDIENYVRSQCDIMEEAASFIETTREEYEIITERFSDIQLIEGAPDNIRKYISSAAEQVDSLIVDRRIFKASEQKLSNNSYHHIEMYEDELPKGIGSLEKQENFFQALQRDMRMLEGERMGLRMESNRLVRRQLKIRKMAMGFIACIICVFLIFLVAMVALDDEKNMALLLVVTVLAAIFALSMFAILKTTEREVVLTEIKLNKATSILNKTKIKYINAANILDYEYNKYHVKSAYELERKYEAYVEMKSEQRKIIQLTSSLNDAELELEKALNKLKLYDTHIWLSQVRALFNPNEMVEVRHSLTVQRQKLRNQIEYNDNKIIEVKNNIKEITIKNPEYSSYALRIIEMYEDKNKGKSQNN